MLRRACGNELNPIKYCPECNEAIHWRCSICEKENENVVFEQRKASMMGGAAAAAVVTLFQVCLVSC